jgi:hypothetical protein
LPMPVKKLALQLVCCSSLYLPLQLVCTVFELWQFS